MSIIKDATKKIEERLTWHTANKDQATIAKKLSEGQDVPEVYGLGDAGLFDEFFCFLHELGFMKILEGLAPKSHRKRKSPISFSAVLMIYLMRIVSGSSFFYHIEPVLLQSQSVMQLVGFNGHQVKQGSNRRSLDKTKINYEDKDSTELRGPLCPEFIASFIVAITSRVVENVFNRVISALAAKGFFPRRIHALMDASDLESSQKCKGCSQVTKERAPELRLRKGRIKKMWVVFDPNSGIPLAMRFATIEVSDITLAREVIQQAIDNLGDHAKIASIAIDRGFMDGKLLWWLNQQKITFYIPAKSNQAIYQDAIQLVEKGHGHRSKRERQRTTGHGKYKKKITDTWDVVGMEELTTAGFYSEQGSGSHEHKSDFKANPLNAVVVVHDPYRENNPNIKTMVILTNGQVTKPLKVYDGYDARSEIENSLFRESKQGWFIKRPPQNSKAGFRVHAYLTIITMALTRAFRDWMVKQQQDFNDRDKDTGIRKFRQKVNRQNADKCIVFFGDRYAIFYLYEILILSGTKVLMPRGVPDNITSDDILRKYGALLE